MFILLVIWSSASDTMVGTISRHVVISLTAVTLDHDLIRFTDDAECRAARGETIGRMY